MMNRDKGIEREDRVNSNDRNKHSERNTSSPAFDAARKTLGNGHAFLQSYSYAVKAIAEMSYKIIEDLKKDGDFGQKKNQEREDQYNQLEENKAEEQYKLFTKKMGKEIINQKDPFYATYGTTSDGLLKDIENDRKRNYQVIDLPIDDLEQFRQNIQNELKKEIKRLKTDEVPDNNANTNQKDLLEQWKFFQKMKKGGQFDSELANIRSSVGARKNFYRTKITQIEKMSESEELSEFHLKEKSDFESEAIISEKYLRILGEKIDRSSTLTKTFYGASSADGSSKESSDPPKDPEEALDYLLTTKVRVIRNAAADQNLNKALTAFKEKMDSLGRAKADSSHATNDLERDFGTRSEIEQITLSDITVMSKCESLQNIQKDLKAEAANRGQGFHHDSSIKNSDAFVNKWNGLIEHGDSIVKQAMKSIIERVRARNIAQAMTTFRPPQVP